MDPVREYYSGQADREWQRLETPSGAVEFEVNCHFIERHLSGRRSRSLDIGGGPGRYALRLAERGQPVVLADAA